MKYLVTLLLICNFGQLFSQKKQCFCEKDTLMNDATIDCATTILGNKSKLYWQFNCTRIWLTLENVNGRKVVLDEVPVEYYGYTYRLGFHLVKEFEKSILFRSGCPANGPCTYLLIDKSSGKQIAEFGQLICIDTDLRDSKKYQFDFVVYFSEDYGKMEIYYVNSKKRLIIPFDTERNNFTSIIPEYQFDRMDLNGDMLTLDYTTDEQEKMQLKLNLTERKSN